MFHQQRNEDDKIGKGNRMEKKVLITYFSGTGGTRKAASAFAKAFLDKGCQTHTFSLDDLRNPDPVRAMECFLKAADALVVLYAVHAFDAPEPIYTWIESLPNDAGRAIPTMVLSVSGGGETWPNTACRHGCIAALEKKGFRVDYEEMLVMPCNWVFALDERLSMHLLRTLPAYARLFTEEFLSGTRKRLPWHKPDIIQQTVPMREKKGIKRFPQTITVGDSCTGCAWCAKHCPTGTISMEGNRPRFGDTCVGCFRCVYGCPSHALSSSNFMVLKKGFSLERLESELAGIERGSDPDAALGDYAPLTRGFFKALKKYLDRGYGAMRSNGAAE